MYRAKSKKGNIYEGTNWLEIPTDDPIEAVSLGVEGVPTQTLTSADAYYYMNEALAFQGDSEGKVVAEIIGATFSKLGIALEVRQEKMGNAGFRLISLIDFPYDKAILR